MSMNEKLEDLKMVTIEDTCLDEICNVMNSAS